MKSGNPAHKLCYSCFQDKVNSKKQQQDQLQGQKQKSTMMASSKTARNTCACGATEKKNALKCGCSESWPSVVKKAWGIFRLAHPKIGHNRTQAMQGNIDKAMQSGVGNKQIAAGIQDPAKCIFGQKCPHGDKCKRNHPSTNQSSTSSSQGKAVIDEKKMMEIVSETVRQLLPQIVHVPTSASITKLSPPPAATSNATQHAGSNFQDACQTIAQFLLSKSLSC
jgi:hypothetical protein